MIAGKILITLLLLQLLLFHHFYIPVSGDQANVLNRILEYWQPNDVYVILNSTAIPVTNGDPSEYALGSMAFPRYVSIRGDFTHFIPQNPIRSVFPDNFALVLFTDDSCRSVVPILRDQLSQEIIVNRSKIIVITSTHIEAESSVARIFRVLWKMGLLNVFLLDTSFIFGYNPFTNNFLIQLPAKDYRHLISIDRAANFHGALLRIPQIKVYPGYQNITWHGRQLMIGETFFTEAPLGSYFNATLRAFPPKEINFGFEFFTNATSSIVHPGIGAELVAGRGDATLIPRAYSTSNYFDFLSPLHLRDCSLLVPKSGQVPQYTIVASVAFSWVGISSIIILVVIVLFTVFIKHILVAKIDMVRFFFELGSVFFNQPYSFKIRTVTMRLVIACWLLTCISLGTLFNAEIVTSFLTTMSVADVDSPFEAIRGDGFNVYTFDDFVYYLRGNSKVLFPSEMVFQQLLRKLKGVPRDEFFDRLMHPNGRDMFLVMAMGANLVEKTKYLTEQTYSYHNTKPLFISLTTNIVPRGSIIYNHFNDFNYRIFEAGLEQHWKTLELLHEIKFGSSNEAQQKSLTIEDLYSAFLVLGLGYALAVAVFAAEIFIAHVSEWTKFSLCGECLLL